MKRMVFCGALLILLTAGVCLAFEWTCPKCKTKNTVTQNPNVCQKCNHRVNLSITCKKCGTKTPVGTEVCPKCGAKLPKVPPAQIKCPHCDKMCKAGGKFCPHCGKKLPQKKKQKQKKKKAQTKKESSESSEESEEPVDPKKAARIQKMVDYYTKTYAKHLSSKDWFVRTLAVISFSKINAPETTEKLMEVLEGDKDYLVRLYAWEALHARAKTLAKDKDLHRRWVVAGVQVAMKGFFRGDTRVGLLKAVQSYGPELKGFDVDNVKLVDYILKTTNHRRPADARTLKQLRKLIAAWKDPKLTKKIAMKMSKSGIGNRAEYVLGGLNKEIEHIGSIANKGVSTADWTSARAAWLKWLKEANLTPPKPGKLKLYTGQSRLIPLARKIKDPDDPKWREDLELGKLRIKQFDLVLCIDSTGSMQKVMQWLARDVEKMLAAFKLICREPRIGATYYRHETDPKYMMDCCEKAKGKKVKSPTTGGKTTVIKNYRTKEFRLTGRVRTLAKAMLQEKAGGAHNNPPGAPTPVAGAVYGGLLTSLNNHPWAKTKTAKKIIVVIGDAPPTKNDSVDTMVPLEKLLPQMVKKGFTIHTVKILLMQQILSDGQIKQLRKQRKHVDIFISAFDKIAKWGNGKSILLQFLAAKTKASSKAQIALPPAGQSNYQAIVGEVLRSALPKGYQDRIDPLVSVLLEYCQSVPEKRHRR
ncbi:MAG: zinc ribbon domain-containing protein [Phycisphaerae bacterium]|nr:zinc ribbon domain-containing protein [Phycisphaerae bacterium]